MSLRPVKRQAEGVPTLEGAGVHLRRAFGFHDPKELDPFLLFDDFSGDDPRLYSKGFPWHPHRGIETITYVLAGEVDHADSLGNKGTLGAGDVQWMTAGSGILHQEMPRGNKKGEMHGFQLWSNLPRALKMTTPNYQDVPGAEIPVRAEDDGTVIRVVTGDWRGIRGPVDGIAAEPSYLDISVPPGVKKRIKVSVDRHAFAYIFAGAGRFTDASKPFGVMLEKEYQGRELNLRDQTGKRTLVVFDRGDEVEIQAGEEGVRFLLISGRPLEEPVAWHGPIVMNTPEELQQAFAELRRGDFIREAATGL